MMGTTGTACLARFILDLAAAPFINELVRFFTTATPPPLTEDDDIIKLDTFLRPATCFGGAIAAVLSAARNRRPLEYSE